MYWEALEDELVAGEPDGGLEAEIEHRAPAGTGAAAVLADGAMRWITDPGGTVAATLSAGRLNESPASGAPQPSIEDGIGMP